MPQTFLNRQRILKFSLLQLLLAAPQAWAVDNAFWKPYQSDDETYIFENFEQKSTDVVGKFGKGHQGPKAHVLKAENLFLTKRGSVELWVKLDAYPSSEAHLIKRQGEAKKSIGFEVTIDANGIPSFAFTPLNTKTIVAKSTQAIPLGQWTHVAGVMARKMVQLYVDGHSVARTDMSVNETLDVINNKELASPDIVIGEGIDGVFDEFRMHQNIGKLWPEPHDPWIERLKVDKLPELSDCFLPDLKVLNSFHFDSPEEDKQKSVRTVSKGKLVDGILGKAHNGPLNISGKLASSEQGALEFWVRPMGFNNLSDRNRTTFRSNLFNLYFFNTTRDMRDYTLLYTTKIDGKRKLMSSRDPEKREIYSGQWSHILINWGKGKVTWYINSKKVGTLDQRFDDQEMKNLIFNPQQYGDVDQVNLYNRSLADIEIHNAYHRYVDPEKMETPREKVANLQYWHLPSTRTLHTLIKPDQGSEGIQAKPILVIQNQKGRTVFEQEAQFSTNIQSFKLPKLDGDYKIFIQLGQKSSPPQDFLREVFEWEDNQLGITDEVFPPFEPIKAKKQSVKTVGREYQMNAFGLYDQIVANDQELLSSPMRLVALDSQQKEMEWRNGTNKLIQNKAHLAQHQSSITCDALVVKADCQTEVDGMTKVKLDIEPVENPKAIERLTIEIPLKGAYAKYMQEVGFHCRSGYTGALKPEQGLIWDSSETINSPDWVNHFTTYIWVGAEKRGLAWFAENDKGWITAKNRDQAIMSLTRQGEDVILRIDLINIPTTITEKTSLVFGLQASPTKPMPKDVRIKANTLPTVGLPVHPWGGLSCSWKSPWLDRWDVVDKVIEARTTGVTDQEYFNNFAAETNPPPVHGKRPWLKDIAIFTNRHVPADNPDPIYFEEMHVLPFLKEYKVFQDEWSYGRLAERSTATVDIYANANGTNVNPNAPTNFSKSYVDYTLSIMEEWWKRGVSIYWDNTYTKLVNNPWTSEAYELEDGRVQPAVTIWNQREYMKRTWNLMHKWRKKGVVRPLEFIAHMTNANMLPLFSWASVNYDMELVQSSYAKRHRDFYTPGEPFTPEYLRVTSTGQQVGNYPYLVHDVFQSSLPAEALGLGTEKRERLIRSWGMRYTHGINTRGKNTFLHLNKSIYAFGDGSADVKAHLDWDDQKAFHIDQDLVKACLLSRKKDKALLLVLQSWSKGPITAKVQLNPEVFGFKPSQHAFDDLNQESVSIHGNQLTASFDLPYDTKIIRIDQETKDPKVLFKDDFNNYLNPGWDYIPAYAEVNNGAIKIGKNKVSWYGKPRIYKYQDLPHFNQGTLNFDFKIEKLADKRFHVFTAEFAKKPEFSKHGLSHSYLHGHVRINLQHDPKKGWFWQAYHRVGKRQKTIAHKGLGRGNTEWNKVSIQLDETGRYKVIFNGEEVLNLQDPSPTTHNAFSITTEERPESSIQSISFDNIVLRSEQPNPEPMMAEKNKVIHRAKEIVSAEVDELKTKIISTFGVFGYKPVYKLVMFRKPLVDVVNLCSLLETEPQINRQKLLIEILYELKKRENEHIENMKAIGQPAHRIKEFTGARAKGIQALKQWKEPAELSEEKAKLIQHLE